VPSTCEHDPGDDSRGAGEVPPQLWAHRTPPMGRSSMSARSAVISTDESSRTNAIPLNPPPSRYASTPVLPMPTAADEHAEEAR